MRTEHVDWRCLCCVCVSPHILKGVEMRSSESKLWPMGRCLRTGWLSLSNCLWLGTSKHLRILIRPSNVVKVVCPDRKWEHNLFNTILGLFFIYFLLWLKKHTAAAAKSLQSCPTVRPHGLQPTRLLRPWDSPGENTEVCCHFLLQCMKVESESEVAQSCLTLSDPMDCSPTVSSIHGMFQATVLDGVGCRCLLKNTHTHTHNIKFTTLTILSA